MLVKRKSVAFDRATWSPVDGRIRNIDSLPARIAVGTKRSGVGVRHHDRTGADIVISRTRSIKRRVRQMAEKHILRERIKEKSIASANDGLTRSENVPRQGDSGGEIPVVGLVNVRQPSGTNSFEAARRG